MAYQLGGFTKSLKSSLMTHFPPKSDSYSQRNFDFYLILVDDSLKVEMQQKAGEVAPPPAVVKPPTVVKPLLVYVRVMGGSAAEKKATACSGMKRRRLEDKPGAVRRRGGSRFTGGD
ncbi:hypothetical protein POM88_030441 [Heracleum sosnowskyi]|uniref:Uncharacterized protein n=1 Tax=Heracleum sosnowskyi TaxID=360622 RepID=A0AAD8HXN1_9APIA|nr:hypothetical protein POM88_030441 [Heracleum sosnowskyi]